MTYIRIRYQKLGGHYHCRLFTTQTANGTYANCGELVFDELEFVEVREKLSRCEWIEDVREAALAVEVSDLYATAAKLIREAGKKYPDFEEEAFLDQLRFALSATPASVAFEAGYAACERGENFQYALAKAFGAADSTASDKGQG